MIPAEAVEALARRNYEAEWGDGWDGVIDQIKRGWLNEARAQCEAAAPYMLAALADSRDGELFRFTWAQREWLRGGAK